MNVHTTVVYEVLPEYKSQVLGEKFKKEWEKKASVFLVFWNLVGKKYFFLGLIRTGLIALLVLRPLLIATLVSYFVPGQTQLTRMHAYLYSSALIGLNIIDTFYRQNYIMMAESLGIRIRAALCSFVYRKTLNLSIKNLRNAPVGKILNLVTRDVSYFEFFFFIFNSSWIGFISITVICYHMYQKIGITVLIFVCGLIIFIPCLIFLGYKIARLKMATSQKTDERIEIFQAALSKIRCTKMYVWEKYVEEKVSEARSKEIAVLFKMCFYMFLLITTTILLQHGSCYLILLTCIWRKQKLRAGDFFFITSSFQSMNEVLAVLIPYATFSFSQVIAALKRFQNIFENLEDNSSKTLLESDKIGIKCDNLSVSLSNRMILNNISFEIDKGLTIVKGASSSGKSVLLLTLLKQFETSKGNLLIGGKISYVPQEPWLFPSTIKQNIIFGSDFNKQRYEEVKKVCALEYDFEVFENGDDTVVAEQGINLSRGQQCRICLARAIYKTSDIYLLDDCLSNLDPLVADLIFRNCIINFLKDKLVILVTNNLGLVRYASHVIELSNGKSKFSKNTNRITTLKKLENRILKREFSKKENDESTCTTKLMAEGKRTKRIYKEFKKSGSVSKIVYSRYINLGGKVYLFVILFSFFVGQICLSYKEKILSDWANLKELNNTLKEERKQIFTVYTIVLLSLAFMILFRGCCLFFFAKNVSVNLHKKMLSCVINAKVIFFDNTYIGNIINRFSKDLVVIDENIPFTIHHLVAITFQTIGVLILIVSVNINFLIPTTVLLLSLFLLRYGYLKTGRALKRLEATTKAPIIGYLKATLGGLPTIRAFGVENKLIEEFDKIQDIHSSVSFSTLSCTKFFVFICDHCVTLLIASVVLKFVLFDEETSAGDVGLAISQAFLMGVNVYFGFLKWADLETEMTAVERAMEYTEFPREHLTGIVPTQWPSFGEIKFENVSLSLDNSKSYILNNLNFTIRSKEKIGVVGRTGAGKSSILSVIFRLYETEGNIVIDGINIRTIPLSIMRSKISIIPQDPLLLQGTIRYNIDPKQQFSCEKLWKILEIVNLKEIFPTLETEVVEAEVTYGQKQLICLARVLLNENKILLLDEIIEIADSSMESLICNIVDEYFASCTVIRITHKMKFVMNCDKVLVIDNGEILEYDSPQYLLQNKNSKFYEMVKKSDLI